MKNEDGVTLIELLATLTIATFFVGTIFLMFSQLNREWSSTTQNYNDESQARLVMDTITSNLADAKSIYYYEDPKNLQSDLRFQTAHYDSNGNPETKEIHFENGTIQIGVISYSNFNSTSIVPPQGVVLARNLVKNQLPSYQIVNGNNQPNTLLTKGMDFGSINNLLQVSINFNYSSTPITTQVKLLDFN